MGWSLIEQKLESLRRAVGQFIGVDLVERMNKAVGFRNLSVHNYDAINWFIVHAIATRHLVDFDDFARALMIFQKQ
ncbi:MAG: DUF86 domain-containing protein [Methylobacter sp.]|jgi:uncharacterized protein YutE (UPF0331/DUF86 family)|nr:DUF86 domain-containing protein [Methylobacter sp.]